MTTKTQSMELISSPKNGLVTKGLIPNPMYLRYFNMMLVVYMAVFQGSQSIFFALTGMRLDVA